jgi:hypothetical protein
MEIQLINGCIYAPIVREMLSMIRFRVDLVETFSSAHSLEGQKLEINRLKNYLDYSEELIRPYLEEAEKNSLALLKITNPNQEEIAHE